MSYIYMKIKTIIVTAILLASLPLITRAQNVWYPTGSPQRLTPVVPTWGLQLPSLTNKPCIGTDSSGNFQTGTCAGGSGGGGGTWSTTTSAVPAFLINYPNNSTDIVVIGAQSTSTAPFIFDPNSGIGYIKGLTGIGTKSPTYPLDVVGLGHFTGLVDAQRFVATSSLASSLPYASTTAFSVSGSTYLTALAQGQLNVGAGGLLYAGASTTFSGPLSYSAGVVSCPTCLTANQTITLTGDVTGSGATSITTTYNNTVPINKGGTGLTSVGASSTVLITNGTADFWQKLATSQLTNDSGFNTGTVTSVATNAGLTGGTINTTGTIGIDTTSIINGLLLQYNGTRLAATGTPSLTTGNLIATSSATSTFAGGIDAARVCIAGTTTCLLPGGGGGSGTVTSITLGGGLDGLTPITTTGTIVAQIGTSTVPILGRLAAWSGNGTPSTLYDVATGTVAQSGPITVTAGQSIIGSGLTIGCTAASVSVAGCLNAVDFSRFNSATSTFSSPLVYTVGTNAVTCPTCNVSNATVSSVATNNGLTGGTITTTGTIGLDTSSILNGLLLQYNGTRLAATGTPSLTVGYLIATSTTATSTLQGTILAQNGGSVGVGTSTPGNAARFGINGSIFFGGAGQATSTGTNGVNLTAGCFSINNSCVGAVTGGGSSSVGPINVLQASNGSGGFLATGTPTLAVGNLIATSSTATSTFAGGINVNNGRLVSDWNTGSTTASNFYEGLPQFDLNAGTVTALDLPISSAATNGTVESYTFNLMGSSTITAYGKSGGNGFTQTGSLGVGIATTSPWRTLSVSGTGAWTGLSTAAGAISGGTYLCEDANFQIISDTATCLVSSRRFKEDIVPLSDDSLSKVLALNPVSFEYKKTGNAQLDARGQQLGFIAEDVVKVEPRLVVLDDTGQPFQVQYENMTALLAKAIQQLNARVDGVARSAEENWQWLALGLLAAGFIYQQFQIRKLKK